jgi:hypothetical protein
MNKSCILIFVTAALFTAGSAHAAVVGSWDFEGNVTDSVSSTAGTLVGSAATDGAAIAPTGSNSLILPDTASYFDTGTNGGLGGTGSFTVFTTIQTDTTSDATIFSYTRDAPNTIGGADLRLFVQGNGDLRIEMSGGSGFEVSDSWDLGDGSAHSVAVLFNGDTGDSFQDVNLYVDGTLYDVTGGTDNTIDLGTTGDTDSIIMGRDHANIRPFVGLIDDFSVYDTALSLTELDTLAATGAIPEPSSAALLLGVGVFGFLIRRRR